jgi:hypothetical protein
MLRKVKMSRDLTIWKKNVDLKNLILTALLIVVVIGLAGFIGVSLYAFVVYVGRPNVPDISLLGIILVAPVALFIFSLAITAILANFDDEEKNED